MPLLNVLGQNQVPALPVKDNVVNKDTLNQKDTLLQKDSASIILEESKLKKKKRKRKKGNDELIIKSNTKNNPTDLFAEKLLQTDTTLRKDLEYYMKVPMHKIRIWIPVAAAPIEYFQGSCALSLNSKESDEAKCYMELISSKKRGNIVFYWKRSVDNESKGCELSRKWEFVGYEINIDPVQRKQGWGYPSSMYYDW